MKKTTKLKLIKFGAIISGLITLIIATYDLLLRFWFIVITGIKFNFLKTSVAIIGGADGPTAVYTTTKIPIHVIQYILFLVFLFITFVCIFTWRGLKKNI